MLYRCITKYKLSVFHYRGASRAMGCRPQVNGRIDERQPGSLGGDKLQRGDRSPPSHHPKILAGGSVPQWGRR